MAGIGAALKPGASDVCAACDVMRLGTDQRETRWRVLRLPAGLERDMEEDEVSRHAQRVTVTVTRRMQKREGVCYRAVLCADSGQPQPRCDRR